MKKTMTLISLMLLVACNDRAVGGNHDNVDAATAPSCGNGIVDVGEECDGNPVDTGPANMCKQLGFDHGTVACFANCTIDTSKCIICGDDEAGGLEACDGENLRGETCETRGYTGGTLTCQPGCWGFDESGCTDVEPAVCGNGIREAEEACDGTDLGGDSCQTAGWTGGELRCADNCLVFDASDCWHQQPE